MEPLQLAISPCPNDTFIFHALVRGLVPCPLSFATAFHDVDELNRMAASGAPHVVKISLAAYPLAAGRYRILSAGAALGRGVGPLLVRAQGTDPEQACRGLVAVPGRHTTANLLLELSNACPGERLFVRYDQVAEAIRSGRAQAGVLIHEGRFTYREQGLELLRDLGSFWEERFGLPLPLGVIAARRDLGAKTAAAVSQCIRASLAHARANPGSWRDFVRSHARELDDAVIDAHIQTFVTGFSHDLEDEGRRAVTVLLQAAFAAAETPESHHPWLWEQS